MKPLTITTWIAAGMLALGPVSLGFAADEQQKDSQRRKLESSEKKSPTVPVYKPPPRGAPGGRVGGGTRGTDQTFTLSVLAPTHTGQTLQEQPALYWYLSKPISAPIEFTLADDGIKPLVETRITPPFQPGVQKVRLADYGVHLVPGKLYKWFVSLVVDPERRSKDILAGGTIERVASPEALAVKLPSDDKRKAAYAYAESGIWYDAIATLSDLVEAAPQDKALHQQRASLLEQAGLAEIAEYDLRAVKAE
jgi:hypothetical protein